jgi:hypothetical protein
MDYCDSRMEKKYINKNGMNIFDFDNYYYIPIEPYPLFYLNKTIL